VPRISRSTTAPGHAERLARVAASDDIHSATPRSAVEGSQVTPDRRRSHGFFFHASRQDRGGEGFPLDVTDDASRSAENKLNPEVESADAGTETEDVDTVTIHTSRPLPGCGFPQSPQSDGCLYAVRSVCFVSAESGGSPGRIGRFAGFGVRYG
jgi:hypothetical protein